MANGANMAVRLNRSDKRALREVAAFWCGGNQAETIRLLVREARSAMSEQEETTKLPGLNSTEVEQNEKEN